MIEQRFMNRKLFTDLVEKSVKDKKLSYIDACVYVCEDEGIDPQDCKKFVGAQVKEKLEAEAIDLHHLPRKNTLIFE